MTRFAAAGVLLVFGIGTLLGADDKALKELEGRYKVLAVEKGGKQLDPKRTESIHVTFKGDEFIFTQADDKEEKKARIKVDASKTPHTIDFVPSEGPEKGKTFPGIYKLDQGELTLVFDEHGERPKDFKSEGRAVLMKLKKDDKK
jgi:uncharacterized protein (TIGR03067 family)